MTYLNGTTDPLFLDMGGRGKGRDGGERGKRGREGLIGEGVREGRIGGEAEGREGLEGGWEDRASG